MPGSCPSGFEQIRADFVRRMFDRTPRLAALIFEPTFAGLCLYTLFTATEPWRRASAGALLLAVVLANLLPKARAARQALRWLLGIGLIAVTGGADSPFLPFLPLSVMAHTALFGRRIGLLHGGLSAVALWAMALFEMHGTGSLVRAGTLTPLLAGALLIGCWIRHMSDHMLRSSLEARDELVAAYGERLRDLSTIQGELAHALKNPLASIKGLAGLMALEPDRVPERLRVLRQEVLRMESILDEYLSFARPLTPLQPEPVDTRAAIAAVAQLHEGMAGEKQVRIDLPTSSIGLIGDPRKLKQMLASLVVNAIEASAPGGVVELTVRRDGDRVVLGVLDHGPGMCAELLARVTEPGVTTKPNGTGLGLTIVRALAEQHGGALRLRNRAQTGLAAEIELPLRCATDPATRPLA